MDTSQVQVKANTSAYFDFFQFMFETTDLVSAYWQTVLKSIGRSQLEVATLHARQGQAFVQWARLMAAPVPPATMIDLQFQFVRTLSDQYAEFAPRMAAAVTHATQVPTASEVLPLPVRKGRDTLVIPDRDMQPDLPFERKVA